VVRAALEVVEVPAQVQPNVIISVASLNVAPITRASFPSLKKLNLNVQSILIQNLYSEPEKHSLLSIKNSQKLRQPPTKLIQQEVP